MPAMSVYTSVSDHEIQSFLQDYDLGSFVSLQGIAQGVTNSNYFLDTDRGRFVLTIFEVLTREELPFFMELSQHLSRNGVACPAPIPRRDGRFDSMLAGKPACLAEFLNGRDTAVPDAAQCFHTGAMLAKMHLAGQSFGQSMPNPRHAAWWEAESRRLLPCLSAEDAELLQNEIHFLAQNPDSHLPRGIIHADLFKDNVLLDGIQVAGFIDFYYACNGSFMYDLAIAVNDWARLADNHIDPQLQQAFLNGYQSVRPLSPEEQAYLPIAHRAGCIRFWVSRLLDYHFPQGGEMTFVKDPDVFRDLLLYFRQCPKSPPQPKSPSASTAKPSAPPAAANPPTISTKTATSSGPNTKAAASAKASCSAATPNPNASPTPANTSPQAKPTAAAATCASSASAASACACTSMKTAAKPCGKKACRRVCL